MALAPRRVRGEQVVSSVLLPTRSLLQGCGQAVDFSRLALRDTSDHIHRRYRPLELGSWVDDLAHQEVGHTASITARAIGVSTQLVTELRRQGFRMSPKSALLASSTALGRTVQEALAAVDIEVELTTAARDLGLDAHGRRRSTKVMQNRLQAAGRKARVIKHLVKVRREARILCRTGFRPTLWGPEAQGMSPSTLKRLRGQVASMCGSRVPGGCSTTAIRLAFTGGG